MNFISVCSGIEAASVAWHPLGWKAAMFSEIEAFPSAVLAHHYPDVPNVGDMTKFKDWPDADVDVLVGGTPCQSFSVAGLRKGLADPRGNLMLTYLAIAARYRPRWLVWENVPGVLSSAEGRDFAAFLGGLGELGYGWAYRVLDAQYFGVAQRRRRVFVVGHLGDWSRAAAVLFERESLRGDSAPRREAGKGVANSLVERPDRGGGNSERQRLIPTVAQTHTRGGQQRLDPETETLIPTTGGGFDVAHSLRGEGFDASKDGTGRGTPLVPVVSPTLRAGGNVTGGHRPPGTDVDTCDSLIPCHAFDARQSNVIQYGDKTGPLDTDGHTVAVAFSCKDHGADAGALAPTLRSMSHDGSHPNGGGQVAIAFAQNQRDEVRTMTVAGALAAEPGAKQQTYAMQAMQVRRLTPRECERLQGFPDDYTLIPVRGKPAADGPRYKALGNSMAVPVMAWLGMRINMVEGLSRSPPEKR